MNSLIAEALPWSLVLQIPAILIGWIVGNVAGRDRGVQGRLVRPRCLRRLAVLLQRPVLLPGDRAALRLSRVQLGHPPDRRRLLLRTESGVLVGLLRRRHHATTGCRSGRWCSSSSAVRRSACGRWPSTSWVRTTSTTTAGWAFGTAPSIRYIFRNAMLPQITGLALAIGGMIGGALITELVFSYPGSARLLFSAIGQNDYPVIQAITLLITIAVLVANFAVDILNGFIDPRIRAAQTRRTLMRLSRNLTPPASGSQWHWSAFVAAGRRDRTADRRHRARTTSSAACTTRRRAAVPMLLGTDNEGQSVLANLVYGTRTSLIVGSRRRRASAPSIGADRRPGRRLPRRTGSTTC